MCNELCCIIVAEDFYVVMRNWSTFEYTDQSTLKIKSPFSIKIQFDTWLLLMNLSQIKELYNKTVWKYLKNFFLIMHYVITIYIPTAYSCLLFFVPIYQTFLADFVSI